MTEGLLIGTFAGVAVSALACLVLVGHIVRLFVRSTDADRAERERLTERLAVRTAATPAEASLQAARTPTPRREPTTDEAFRHAHRSDQPMGL